MKRFLGKKETCLSQCIYENGHETWKVLKCQHKMQKFIETLGFQYLVLNCVLEFFFKTHSMFGEVKIAGLLFNLLKHISKNSEN